jgi:hypothetical protein
MASIKGKEEAQMRDAALVAFHTPWSATGITHAVKEWLLPHNTSRSSTNVDIDSNIENVDPVLPNSAGSCGTIYALGECMLIGSLRLNPRYCLFIKHVADHCDRHDKGNRWCGVAAWRIWRNGLPFGKEGSGRQKAARKLDLAQPCVLSLP